MKFYYLVEVSISEVEDMDRKDMEMDRQAM